ncbi:MAG TPA: phage holin family protein [Gemmatimonadaceae bacterium]|nr:phage holin family protein [Gemmatimonadaceae bacterium]
MGARLHNGDSIPLGALLKELAEGSTALIRQEARLARLEITDTLRTVGKGATLIVSGVVLLLLGGLALLTGLIMLGGDQWLRDRYWLAALVVFVLAGGVSLWCAARGRALLSPRQLAPTETVESLKEDTAWLKQQLTSGGTSS